MLSDIPAPTDDRVLVDFRTADDAGVYRWEAGPALVQTVDFFTPIVDDPYTYGQIAAANAISDIYAMGGTPLTALAIAGFPKDEVDRETIQAIFRGGFATLREAGVSLLGGHTVQDREIKFGYAVTGAIDPARILTNAGAQPGDILFLTKPIGTGIVGTAIKFDRAPAALVDEAVASMRTLNRAACEALKALPAGAVHACTDITGFGLAGHASE
ncbi:MAG: selenide, water dikinase SelD, partial [Acidobacteria bacterium]